MHEAAGSCSGVVERSSLGASYIVVYWQLRLFGSPDISYIGMETIPYGTRDYLLVHGQMLVLHTFYYQCDYLLQEILGAVEYS